MTLLAPIAPGVVPGRAIDIPDVAADRGVSRGFARVDLGDPVFFDHPLDHVPGMLLVAAILELAEHNSMLESDNITFRLTFTKFCELGAPVETTATREAGGTSRIEVIQSGRSIAKGLLGRCDTQPLIERVPVPALGDEPISGELVHRANPHNIAIGPLTVEDGHVWTRVREQSAVSGLPSRASAVASITMLGGCGGSSLTHPLGNLARVSREVAPVSKLERVREPCDSRCGGQMTAEHDSTATIEELPGSRRATARWRASSVSWRPPARRGPDRRGALPACRRRTRSHPSPRSAFGSSRVDASRMLFGPAAGCVA
jgi:hypothetical protein